jgi:membrane-bound inhibitor of C-type lysozyme
VKSLPSTRGILPDKAIGLLCVVLAIGLAGCASQNPARTETYRCYDGRGFSVSYTERGAGIEIAGMRFVLQPEQASGDGETYGCSELTLWRDGKTASVTLDGTKAWEGCRRLR